MPSSKPVAVLHRLATPDHLCPWGLKALDLLKRKGFAVEDHLLPSREAGAAFKREHGVDETPQIWIGGRHIGGYDALRAHLGLRPEEAAETTYRPVIAVFAVCLALALAISSAMQPFTPLRIAETFVALAMAVLGLLKLQDLSGFSIQFLGYDLLARRHPRYAFVYPFVETAAGVMMLAGWLPWLAAPAALFIGSVGAISVFKAVYLDRRELTCACVGGNSRVPLGFVSLSENLLMLAMAVWMLVRAAHS